MTCLLRVLVLLWSAHDVYPDAGAVPLARAVIEAIAAGDESDIPPELLLAIARHESDLEPHAVSWVSGGKRRDAVRPTSATSYPATCGYLQGVALTEAECLNQDMRTGARELASWRASQHGDLRAGLLGFACGNRGVAGLPCPFAALFLAHARRLGWRKAGS